MATDKTTIKNWFKTGLKPTQAQFWATWDSYWHKDEIISISNIQNLEKVLDNKASTNHSHSDYATNDASSLTDANIISWQKTLKISNLKFDDKAITITQDYSDFGLAKGATINSFNNEIYQAVRNKLDAPLENSTNEYVLLADGSTVKKGDLPNFANTDLEVKSKRKHTGTSSVEFGMPLVVSNENLKFSALVNKSTDATYNRFLTTDSNGNVNYLDNIANAFTSSLKLMTKSQIEGIMRLFNGQYSTGQISVGVILDPVIELNDNNKESSLLTVMLIGENLYINPDTSYVRIKEQGNSSNWVSCLFNNINSQELQVFVPTSFIEKGKSYLFEIKHSVQLYTTPMTLLVVSEITDYNIDNLTYITTNSDFNKNGEYRSTEILSNTITSKNETYTDSQGSGVLRGIKCRKIRSSEFANKDDNFIINISFDSSYETENFEFPRNYDFFGVARIQNTYPNNDLSNNMVSGLGVGFKTFMNGDPRTSLLNGNYLPKNGSGQCFIFKNGNIITTIIKLNSGGIMSSVLNSTFTTSFNFEALYETKQVGVKNIVKDISMFQINSIKKFKL